MADDPLTPLIARGVETALAGFTRGLDGIIAATLKSSPRRRRIAASASACRSCSATVRPAIRRSRSATGAWPSPATTATTWKSTTAASSTPGSSKAALAEAAASPAATPCPPEFYQQLMTIMAEEDSFGPALSSCRWPRATLQMPYLDITTVQSAGVSPFFGGMQMSWTAEAQTRTETEPQFKQMELKAWELSGYTVSSNVLLQDSVVGLEKFLMMLFARAIAWYEDFAFLQGSGVGKPQGILNCPAAIAVSRNTASQVQFVDVATMWSKLLPMSWNKAFWVFSPSVVPQLLQLKDGANRAIFISIDQGAAKAPNWSLLGRPAMATEKIPALGTKGDLMLIDPQLYVIGDRMSIEIAASEHVNFLNRTRTITGQGRKRRINVNCRGNATSQELPPGSRHLDRIVPYKRVRPGHRISAFRARTDNLAGTLSIVFLLEKSYIRA